MGRPTKYTEDLANVICEELIAGRSLRQICNDEEMPNRVTVIRWMGKDIDFATKCAHARNEQADLMDDRILDVVDKCEAGTIDPHAAKVVISGLQWRASKLKPKKYGDKIELSGDKANPLAHKITVGDELAEILTLEQLEKVKEIVLTKSNAG